MTKQYHDEMRFSQELYYLGVWLCILRYSCPLAEISQWTKPDDDHVQATTTSVANNQISHRQLQGHFQCTVKTTAYLLRSLEGNPAG